MYRALSFLFLMIAPCAFSQETWQAVAPRLEVTPGYVVAIRDLPFTVGFSLNREDFSNSEDVLPDGWTLQAAYAPPGGQSPIPQSVPLAWSGQFSFPAGGAAGMGRLESWRIVDEQGGTVRLFDTVVSVEVIGEALVPQAEIHRLSVQEMRELGVAVGDQNLVGVQVSLGIEEEVEEQVSVGLTQEITLIKDTVTGSYEPIVPIPSLYYAVPVSIEFNETETSVGLSTSGGIALLPEMPLPKRKLPQIDAVIVFPANIGFLNGFFKPTLILLNVAPEGTPYEFSNLFATIDFPGSAFRLPALDGQPQFADAKVFGPGADLLIGTPDDTNRVKPQQQAKASWVLEGLKPGEHEIDFNFRATLVAEDGGSYPIKGTAKAFLYIRRPEMDLRFDVPARVEEQEVFYIDAVFTKTNAVPIDGLTFDVDGAAVKGAEYLDQSITVNGQSATEVNLGNKGDEAVFSLRFKSLTTGRVKVSKVESGSSGSAIFNYSINVAVGDPVAPQAQVTLVLPQVLDQIDQAPFNMPLEIKTGLRKMAGEALLLSTIPPGTQQDGFDHIPKSAVGKWLERLALTVLRPRSGSPELQQRSLALDMYLATLAQADVLLAFLGQNDHYLAWSQTLESLIGSFDTIPTNQLMAPPQTLLFDGPTGTQIPLTLALGDRQGYTLANDFDELIWHHPGGDLSGLFFRGGRWETFAFSGLAEGSIRLIWNGFDFQVLLDESRVIGTRTQGEALPPQFLGVRQIGYETFSNPSQVDPFGRQLLFFFSESVELNPDFVGQFQVDNNFFTHAQKLSDQVVKVWARNPMGLIERDIAFNGSVRTSRGPAFEASTHPIAMSPRWDAVPIRGRVVGPDGEAAVGATVNLVHFVPAKNRPRQIEYNDYDSLVSAGLTEIAEEVQAILNNAGEAYQQTQQGSLVLPVEFQALIGQDGRYEVDNWPFYKSHHWGANNPYRLPDLQWQVRYGDRVINREIFGRARNLTVIRDFSFPAVGNFFVHVPPLPDGQSPEPTDIIRVVATDKDENFVDLVMQPGDRVEVEGLRLGTVSILAKAIGSFDAKTILLGPETVGSTVVLTPATVPGEVLAKVRTLDEDGNQVPLKSGHLFIFHFAAIFGGNPGQPALIDTIDLKSNDDGDLSFEVPEGPIEVVYVDKDYYQPWQSLSIVPGETHDLGTFLIEPPSTVTGTVNILVQDELGNPIPGYPVAITDRRANSQGVTDANGRVSFENIREGLGYAQIADRSGETIREFFTLTDPTQLETAITFTVSQPFTLTVLARDETGQPLPGAWIEASWNRGGDSDATFYQSSGYADGTGRFVFEFDTVIPAPEIPIRLEVLSPVTFRRGHRIYVRPQDVYQAETEVAIAEVGGLDITVAAGDTLENLPDVWVEVADSAGAVFAGVTDENGKVRILGLADGAVTISVFPTLGLVQTYKQTTAMAVVSSGQVVPLGVFLDPKEEVDPPIVIDIEGQIFDAYNQVLNSPANFSLTATVSDLNLNVVTVPLGRHLSNPDGSFELTGVQIPAGEWTNLQITGKAYQDATGNDGFVKVHCEFRTSGIFVAMQLSEQIQIPVRVWNTLGSRVTEGQVTYSQQKIINQALDVDFVEETITLSEDDFTPSFSVSAGRNYCFTYEGAASSTNAFCERTVSFLHEAGRPTNIVVQATTELAIQLYDGDDQPLTASATILLFKNQRLWEERIYEPDPQSGFMTFEELPTGNWQVLAADLTTGYSASWYGDVSDEPESITLKIQRGEDFIGKVVYENGQEVPNVHLQLYRSLTTLELSLTSVNGRSSQTLLNTSESDGSFLYPGLSRGSYRLVAYDPLTGRQASSAFTFPQSNDFQIVIPPTGQVQIDVSLVTGDPAVGAKITGYNSRTAPISAVADGITGSWQSGFLETGAWTFEIESLDGSQATVFTAEVKTNDVTAVETKLELPEYTPRIGFKWLETNDYLDERISLEWIWFSPGRLARRSGKVVYPTGEPLDYQFFEGRLYLIVEVQATEDHPVLQRRFVLDLDKPGTQEVDFTLEIPRKLEVTLVDQFTFEPFAGAAVSTPYGRAFTDDSGKAVIKNLKRGTAVAINALSGDQTFYGAGHITIGNNLITQITVPMNPNIGDAAFQFTQRELPFNRGLLKLTGNGAFYSQLLDGQDQLQFRKLIQGTYNYELLDPLSGITVKGSVTVSPSQTTTKTIDIPGTAPLTFVGTYQGGYDIPEGQEFQLKTPLRTYKTKMKETNGGELIADFGFIPEGTWRVSTPTIPTNQWYPSVTVNFGTFNRLEAYGDDSLPYWSNIIVRFADYHGNPINRFIVKLRQPNSSSYFQQRYGYNGLATLTVSPGTKIADVDIINSPFFLRDNYVYAPGPGQGDNPEVTNILDLQLSEPTGSVTFAARDTEGRFLTTQVRPSMTRYPPNSYPGYGYRDYDLGDFGQKDATPFVTFDYLPLGATYSFLVNYQSQVSQPFEKVVTQEYIEYEDIILDVVPPEATWDIVWDQNRAFTLEVRTNKPVADVRLDSPIDRTFFHDEVDDVWRLTIPHFKHPWKIGTNAINIDVKGISGITTQIFDEITWNSTHDLVITPETAITGLPANIDVSFADPGVEVDPTRFENVPSYLTAHLMRINYNYLDVVPQDDNSGIRYHLDLLSSPWRLGTNNVTALLIDSEGNPSEETFSLITDLPALGAITINNLRRRTADTEIDVTITAQAPDGTRTVYNSSGLNQWSLTNMAYGEWTFFIENHWSVEPSLAIEVVEIVQPTVRNISPVYLAVQSQTVTLLDSDGNPAANQEIRLGHIRVGIAPGIQPEILWDLGTITTDENGQFTYDLFAVTRWYVWLEWDRGTYLFGKEIRYNQTQVQDFGIGDMRIKVTDALTQFQPIPGLEIYLQDQLVGLTDVQGEWISENQFQANDYYNLRIAGTTEDLGEVDYEATIVTVPNRLNIELEYEPYYEGTLELQPSSPVSPLVAEVRVDDQRFFPPFDQAIPLQLQEGTYLARALDANGRTWYAEDVFVARNIVTTFTIDDPDQGTISQPSVTVIDAQGDPVANARISVDGNDLGATDGNGTFSFAIIPGDHHIAASHETGFVSQAFTSSADSPTQVNLTLGGFSPSGIANNVMWFNADAATLQRQPDERVSAWVNLAPVAQHANQQNLDLQPLFQEAGLQGKPAVQFDPEREDLLDLGSGYEDFSLGFTAFIVTRSEPMERTGGMLVFDDSTPDTGTFGFVRSDYLEHLYFDGLAIEEGFPHYEPTVFAGTQQGTVLKVFRNAVEMGQTTRPALPVKVRNFNAIGRRFGGQISEVIVYNRTLNDTERDQISLYLAEKYGLYHPQAAWVQALPAVARAYVAERHLNQAIGERYAGFLSEHPDVPAEGLRLWLNAAEGLAAENDAVTQWLDQSYFATPANFREDPIQPLPLNVTSGGPLAGPAVNFTGGTVLELNDMAPAMNHTSTVIAVMKPQPLPTNSFPQFMGGARIDSTSSEYWIRLDRDGYLELQGQDYNQTSLFDQWNLVTAIKLADSTGAVRINGVQSPNQTFSDRNLNERFWIGATVTADGDPYFSPFLGEIAELLIYEDLLDDAELQRIEGYLAAKYNFNYELAAPVFSPEGGIYTTAQAVTLTSLFPNAIIHYTTDGSVPTALSPSVLSGESVLVESDTVLRARVIIPNLDPGAIASAHYIIGELTATEVVIDTDTTIFAVGTTGQDFEGKDLILNGANVVAIGPHQFNSMRLINGSVLSHVQNDEQGLALEITEDLEIDLLSAIDVSAKGYGAAQGPGQGYSNSVAGTGAGYGGRGGTNRLNNSRGITYGDPFAPDALGSGGGHDGSSGGGLGGGLIKLLIGGTLTLDGRIAANGGNGFSDGGGGSGGGIHIVANAIEQNGPIEANGGVGIEDGPAIDQGAGGGGGGRIALAYDEASSTIQPNLVTVRENLGQFAEHGSLVFNNVEIEPSFEFGIYFQKVNHPGDQYQVRLDHQDGRSLVEDLVDREITFFPGVTRNETWSVSWSDGIQWYPYSQITTGKQMTDVRQVRICESENVTFQVERDLRAYDLTWEIDGVPVEVEPDERPTVTYYRFNVFPGSATHRIEGFIPGFTSPAIVYENFFECYDSLPSQIYRYPEWARSRLLTRAADGASSLPSGHGARLTQAVLVDRQTGAEMPLGTANGDGTLSLSEFRAPIDGTAYIRYRYDHETVGNLLNEGDLDFAGLQVGSTSYWEVPLPYAVWEGTFELNDGTPVHPSKRMEIGLPEGSGDRLDYDEVDLTFKIVRQVPNDRFFSFDYRVDFIIESLVDYQTASMVETGAYRMPPHSELLVPQNTPADFVTVYGGKDLTSYTWPDAPSSYLPDTFPQASGTYSGYTNQEAVPFYFSPGTYWTASADVFENQYGYFENAGETHTLPWGPGATTMPVGGIEVNYAGLLGFFGIDGNPPSVNHKIYLRIFTEKAGAIPYGRCYVDDYDESCYQELPLEGKAWFVFYSQRKYTYPDTGGGEGEGDGEGDGGCCVGGKRTFKALSGVQSWIVEHDLSPDDVANGITLTPTDLGVQTFTWDASHGLAVMPGALARYHDDSRFNPSQFYELTFTLGGHSSTIPAQFIYNPLGWFAYTDVFTSDTEMKLAWRTRVENFNDLLGNQTLQIPVNFQSARDQDLSAEIVYPGDSYMFGMLYGRQGAIVDPIVSMPEEGSLIYDPGDGEGDIPTRSDYRFTIDLPIPESPPASFDLVFPMWLEAYDPGQSTLTFENDFIDWRDLFDPTTDTFWLSLPESWRDALNWVVPE